MSVTSLLAAAAFAAGFAWGFTSPKRYCHQSTKQARAFGNRLASGIVNAMVLAAIVFVVAYAVFGPGPT